MKRRTIRVACIAMLGLMTAGCQQEPIFEHQNVTEQIGTYTVCYTVGETTMQTSLCDDTSLEALLLQLTALARQGYSISVVDSRVANNTVSTKETVIYRTRNENDAAAWSANMIKQGYHVDISFDDTTGEFVCIATK